MLPETVYKVSADNKKCSQAGFQKGSKDGLQKVSQGYMNGTCELAGYTYQADAKSVWYKP